MDIIYVPSIDMVLVSCSPICEMYLVAEAAAVVDPPCRSGGYAFVPEWLDNALHLAATVWSARHAIQTQY